MREAGRVLHQVAMPRSGASAETTTTAAAVAIPRQCREIHCVAGTVGVWLGTGTSDTAPDLDGTNAGLYPADVLVTLYPRQGGAEVDGDLYLYYEAVSSTGTLTISFLW